MVISGVLIQILLLPLAGYALFRLFRHVAAAGKWIGVIVALGVAGRAFLGQLLFWVSYLPVRVPAGMEDDNGIWFFARDGRDYFHRAGDIVASGLPAIFEYSSIQAAAFFVKLLAGFMYVFGSVASVAVLMNIFAYLGTCAALLTLFRGGTRPTLIAIAAVSLSPSLMLWSLQPLKDVLFFFIVVVFVAAAAAWQDLWRSTAKWPAQWWRLIATAILLVLCIYAIAGIRWYFALLIVACSVPFFIFTTLRRGWWRIVPASAVVFVAMVAAFYAGGGKYVPASLRIFDQPSQTAATIRGVPGYVTWLLGAVRRGFRLTAANSDITAPEPAAPPDAGTQDPAAPVPPATPPPTQTDLGTDAIRSTYETLVRVALLVTAGPAAASPQVSEEGAEGASFREDAAAANTPRSAIKQMLPGFWAMLLPRFIGQPFGLFRVGGDQGLMWIFAEADTLFFDAVLIVALLALWRGLRTGAWRTPVLALLILMTVVLAGVLTYTVTNFGTLIRLRGMVSIGLVMIPLVISAEMARRQRDLSSRA